MNDEYPLSKEEKDMVLLWRSLQSSEVRVTFQNMKPIGAKVYYPGLLYSQEISNHPIDELEKQVIACGRLLKWGDLVLHIERGSPIEIMHDTFQSVKFGLQP